MFASSILPCLGGRTGEPGWVLMDKRYIYILFYHTLSIDNQSISKDYFELIGMLSF